MSTYDTIPTITPEKAVERLRGLGMTIGVETMREGLKSGVFPFGFAIRNRDCRYYIFEKLFDEWIKERTVRKPISPTMEMYLTEKGGITNA